LRQRLQTTFVADAGLISSSEYCQALESAGFSDVGCEDLSVEGAPDLRPK